MSKFTTNKINKTEPYVPGEQLRDKRYIKLNTNENPYYASKFAVDKVDGNLLSRLNRYSDPESSNLTTALAKYYGVTNQNILVTNGSDEALAFAFMAYCTSGVAYPDVTYGFYDVIAGLFDCPVEHIPLNNDFTIDVASFKNKRKTVVIANPNAQTGIELSRSEIEEIIQNNADNIVIIDQAYADFGTVNVIELIGKYQNLIAVNTFSKSRSLAGARVGYVIADEQLIADLKKIKNSFHPYNVNTVSSALAEQSILDDEYFKESVRRVIKGRNELTAGLENFGFSVLPSSANFVLARHNKISGKKLYSILKDKGILVRHFSIKRIEDYVRITVGTQEETEKLLEAIEEILTEYAE